MNKIINEFRRVGGIEFVKKVLRGWLVDVFFVFLISVTVIGVLRDYVFNFI